MTTTADAESTAAPRLRRSVIYVPADNARAVAKAPTLGADAIVYDLEDAVAPAAKPGARAALVALLAGARPAGVEIVIRVNATGSGELDADLAAVAAARPDAVLLPKVDGPGDLQAFGQAADRARTPETMSSWAMVETAAGLVALDAMVTEGRRMRPRLDCVVVGTNDIVKETGVDAGDGRALLLPWLMNVVLVAKRHRVAVLDGVWNAFRDTAGFDAEVRQSARMGFDGKTLIHPSQVEPANRAFAPAAAAVAEARRIVAAFAEPAHANANVIDLDGRMVERLHLEQARRLLEAYARASKA